MSLFVASGHVFDLVIAVLVIEAIAIVYHHRSTGRGVSPADLAGTFVAGLGLLLAARFAVTGWAAEWVGASLVLAFLGHAADLARRWRSSR